METPGIGKRSFNFFVFAVLGEEVSREIAFAQERIIESQLFEEKELCSIQNVLFSELLISASPGKKHAALEGAPRQNVKKFSNGHNTFWTVKMV